MYNLCKFLCLEGKWMQNNLQVLFQSLFNKINANLHGHDAMQASYACRIDLQEMLQRSICNAMVVAGK